MAHDSDPLYTIAVAADDAWQAELVRVYGRAGQDARYDYRRGRATPLLEALWRAKRLADDDWYHACLARARRAA